jgi:GxxExxY protein
VDFICYGEVLVELKACAIGPIETAQLINYLRAAGRNRGLLLVTARRACSTNASCSIWRRPVSRSERVAS